MRDLFGKEFQEEMDDFFHYIDHEVLGKPVEEPEVEEITDEEVEKIKIRNKNKALGSEL